MLFKFIVAVLLCTVAVVEVRAQCSHTNPCQISGGENYQKIQEVSSLNGKLDLQLSVEMGTFQFDWLTIIRRIYNASASGISSTLLPGPTWRIRPGDNVTVNLKNNLELTAIEKREENFLRFPNRTNLHTHGLHVSSEVGSDNVFVNIDPGENSTYNYQIETDHPAGTYWYHAHLHGSTMFQVQGGLAGMIIVEDPTTGPAMMPDHLAAISCPANCQHEVPLLFQPILQYADPNGLGRGFGQLQKPSSMNDSEEFRHLEEIDQGGTLENWLINPSNKIDHVTTNGILFPVISFPTGQRKRFRMVNAAGSKSLELLITDENGNTPTDACEVREIAYDGIYLNETRVPRLGKTFLVPSSKADWIVVCYQPGTYELRSVPNALDSCSIGDTERHDGLLMKLRITGNSATPTVQETELPQRPDYVSDFRNYSPNNVSGHFVVEANSKQFLNREHFSGPDYYRFVVEVGTVQEWYLLNSDPQFSHPMHIHVNNFQIISYNQYNGPISVTSISNSSNIVFYSVDGKVCSHQSSSFTEGDIGCFEKINFVDGTTPCYKGNVVYHNQRAQTGGPGTLGYVEPGDFRDVVMVPPLSNITIRFLAHKFTGEIVIHCHILIHEDLGMMMTVNAVNAGGDLTAHNQKSGNALPGECGAPSGSDSVKFNLFVIILLVVAAMTREVLPF